MLVINVFKIIIDYDVYKYGYILFPLRIVFRMQQFIIELKSNTSSITMTYLTTTVYFTTFQHPLIHFFKI